jgi:hypothetical protein
MNGCSECSAIDDGQCMASLPLGRSSNQVSVISGETSRRSEKADMLVEHAKHVAASCTRLSPQPCQLSGRYQSETDVKRACPALELITVHNHKSARVISRVQRTAIRLDLMEGPSGAATDIRRRSISSSATATAASSKP